MGAMCVLSSREGDVKTLVQRKPTAVLKAEPGLFSTVAFRVSKLNLSRS